MDSNSESDIDLFVIENLGLQDLSKLIKKPAILLKREINPHVMNVAEFQKKFLEMNTSYQMLLIPPNS